MRNVIKTLGPLHFEDLEPRRFQDLTRQLIYNYKVWQDIEDTGKLGSDEGFDIRAWEKVQVEEEIVDDKEDKIPNPITGNLWMIQCKRYKQIGPKRVSQILDECLKNKSDKPYGYMLIAPCYFSKKARDVFRSKLLSLGVKEFHLWGKGELEDRLFLPDIDRLLYAYFGISLLIKQRSLRLAINSKLIVKNKIISIFGVEGRGFHPIFIRDANDKSYPYKNEVKDFDKFPLWGEYQFTKCLPEGILVLVHKHFAYIDDKGEKWDYVRKVDEIHRQYVQWNKESENFDLRQRVWSYWRNLPEKNQAYLEVEGTIPYEEIIAIDKYGDVYVPIPHIFVEFIPKYGPFRYFTGIIRMYNFGPQKKIAAKDEDRIKFFPSKFPKPKQDPLVGQSSKQERNPPEIKK